MLCCSEISRRDANGASAVLRGTLGSKHTAALPGGLLKHSCPFSPTYLIAVGALINFLCPQPER